MHTTAAPVAHQHQHTPKTVEGVLDTHPPRAGGEAADSQPSSPPHLPRLDQVPLEVMSLVASLIPPPFYLLPPPEEPSPTPQPHVIENLDPSQPPERTSAQTLSAITKTCSHVLEAARPWLWENVDVRSGRGWLAVVDALTEEVVDIPAEEEVAAADLVSRSNSTAGTRTPPEAQRSASAGPSTYTSPLPQNVQEPVTVPLQVSMPVGTGATRSVPARAVTINTTVSQTTYRPDEPTSSRSPSTNLRTEASPSPDSRRLDRILTPPGSRTTSPMGLGHPRLRGRSRSPRRNLRFDEGISSVLQRSMSLSLPGGHRPLLRTSSLSQSRVVREADLEEEMSDGELPDHSESLRTAMRTPPKEEPRELPPDPEEEEDVQPNANPDLLPPPGPYLRHLSFTNFRTIGSRRSQDEAVRGRFVTAGRLEGVLKNTPNLRSLCMTEYVDSSLSYEVLEEIFFRGYGQPRSYGEDSLSPGQRRGRSLSIPMPSPMEEPSESQTTIDDQMDPPRPEYVPYEDETEEDKWARRKQFTPLEAVDLTGCVSRTFAAAVDEFGDNWLNMGGDDAEDQERGRSRSRRFVTEPNSEDDHLPLSERRTHRPLFTGLRRLSLRACTNLHAKFITHLILAMPNLTHLDLSGTRVPDDLIHALTQHPPPGMQLQSLSLARCPRLDPSCVVDFLVESPAAREIVDLNLFVNPTQGNALGQYDVQRLITSAPCFKSGRLRYLDMSSAAFTAEHLAADVMPPQPSLVSLGLSHIPNLRLRDIADFLRDSAPGVEILTLTGTAIADLRPDASTLQITLCLHAQLINPLTTVPFSLGSINMSGDYRKVDLTAGPTRLRVVELSSAIRRSLDPSKGSGRTEWQVVKSKGGRGWYVDVSAGWIPSASVENWGYAQEPGLASVGEGLGALSFVRHLPAHHPRRRYLTYLAEANGRVRSDVGWHSRKMEVVRGEGMMGREEGMGGVGAFAFEE